MIIDCISDLHGHYPELEGGDLLIVAGDLTARDTILEHAEFIKWLSNVNYKKVIVIAGNHDGCLVDPTTAKALFSYIPLADVNAEYLQDSGTEFDGLKIWGSPWTLTFPGMNPHCKAFTVDTEEELAKKWDLIPDNVDILVTHSPAYGNFDFLKNSESESVGSRTLWEKLKVASIKPKLFVFGHIHESYGYGTRRNNPTIYVNASHVNEHYEPVNKPIRIVL